MSSAVPKENPDEVLASIRRIVAEESSSTAGPTPGSSAKQAAERAPMFSGAVSAAKVAQNRRSQALRQAKRKFEERIAERAAQEPNYEDTNTGKMCKLLLTEDFQVRGPDENRMVFPAVPDASQGYTEDSDIPEDEPKPTLESVVRDAVADSVRAALHGAVAADEDPELLDEDGYIDTETLRALVMSIVHEELRGELGRQISARVRKLVRQEINRALQVQTLHF